MLPVSRRIGINNVAVRSKPICRRSSLVAHGSYYRLFGGFFKALQFAPYFFRSSYAAPGEFICSTSALTLLSAAASRISFISWPLVAACVPPSRVCSTEAPSTIGPLILITATLSPTATSAHYYCCRPAAKQQTTKRQSAKQRL